MKLSNEAVQEYKELIRQEFGHDITEEEARESAEGFMQIALLVSEQPLAEQPRRLRVYCKCGPTNQ